MTSEESEASPRVRAAITALVNGDDELMASMILDRDDCMTLKEQTDFLVRALGAAIGIAAGLVCVLAAERDVDPSDAWQTYLAEVGCG